MPAAAPARVARLHLDPLGGLAGDMFAAAMADAFPDLVPGLLRELAKLQTGDGPQIRFVEHRDGAIVGRRFLVEEVHADRVRHEHTHAQGHGHGEHGHLHVPHARIREQLRAAGLDGPVLEHTLALFQALAEAEARVHGVAPDAVEFHEVGAWDSIVDFVAAGYFIAALAPARWTCAPLPLGAGRVNTAHGVLPVPAPATTRLLQGLAVVDDGIPGERVTPTGAAIVRHLADRAPALAIQHTSRLAATGHGFGSRKLPGVPNLLRVLAFAEADTAGTGTDEEVATLHFEVDDQPAEDLAVALDRIREAPGVLDASQLAVYGKKNRLATQVQVLARPDAAEAVADLCLAQTTTLGVRIARVRRRTLARSLVEARIPEPIRVKLAERPGATPTAKAEMDDLARIPGGRAEREDARRRAEAQALEHANPNASRNPHDD